MRMNTPPSPRQVLEFMDECQLHLDLLGAGVAAAHLDLAIEMLRNQFDLKENSSAFDPSSNTYR